MTPVCFLAFRAIAAHKINRAMGVLIALKSKMANTSQPELRFVELWRMVRAWGKNHEIKNCLLYTSDAADD